MRKSHLLLLAATALAGMSAPALAQETAAKDDPGSNLEISDGDIVVTARRKEEAISKVPIAITAFSGETLASKQIDSVLDLTKLTPGLNFGGGGALSSSVVTIRGFSRALAGPGSPGVISYFNEVPLNNYGSNIPTYDMSNLQVLKGPQGTLFGRNAIGGAILTYSKRPTYETGGYIEGEYGSFNTARIEGAINLPIVADKVALRVAGQMRDSDGFVDGILYSPTVIQRGPTNPPPFFVVTPGTRLNAQPINLDKTSTKAVRVSLLMEPVEGLSNVTVVDYTQLKGISGIAPTSIVPGSLVSLPAAVRTGALGAVVGALVNPAWSCASGALNCNIANAVAVGIANPRLQYTDVTPNNTVRIFGITNTTSFQLNDNLTLKNIFGYRTLKIANSTDLDGTAVNIIGTASVTNQRQVSDELQLSGSLAEKLQFVVGGFYLKTSPNGFGGDQALMATVLGGLSSGYSINYLNATSKAVYGQLDFDASDLISGLNFTAGYRHTWDKQNTCAYGANYSEPGQLFSDRISPAPGVAPTNAPSYAQCLAGTFTDPDAVPGTSNSDRFTAKSNKGTYTFAANWQVSDEVLLYATARRGYRAGGSNVPRLQASAADAQNFAPEVYDDIEIGTKGRLNVGGATINFTLAGFRGKVKGAQTFVGTQGLPATFCNGCSGLVLNKNDYTQKGVEGSLQLNVLDGLSIGGNFAYMTASLDRLNVPASVLAVYTAAGIQGTFNSFAIFNQPDWQVNGNIEYTVRDALAGANFRIGADVHYQTSYLQNDFSVPGYTTVDGRAGLVGLMDGKVDVTVWAKNMLNAKYYYGGSLSARAVGVFTYLMAPPRSIGATIRYRFGGSE